MKFKNTEKLPKYRIQGKTYYKLAEETPVEEWKGIVDEIWVMKDSNCNDYRLCIRKGKGKSGSRYKLYDSNNRNIADTYSISQVKEK